MTAAFLCIAALIVTFGCFAFDELTKPTRFTAPPREPRNTIAHTGRG